ncbi:MAG: tRNA (adenosine(37)-N6)-threonylcarbamoyltransferase complex dimerization subunit type 1 TsaB [Ferruginibacter sp.]
MGLIINIDTAIDTTCISIAKDGEIIAVSSNSAQKDHGGFLQPAIKALLRNISLSIRDLDAVAISAGPGSYTGLRVGMASAKGICYALNKPLITIGTLEILAFAAILEANKETISPGSMFCPLIDARRMEVFTAIYNQQLETVLSPCAMILDENSFANRLLKNKILFVGNGAKKWELICKHENAKFITVFSNALAMSRLSFKKYEYDDFADLAYSEPLYLKEFPGSQTQN